MKFSDECILATLDEPKTRAEIRREWPEIAHVGRCLRRLRKAGLVDVSDGGQRVLWGRPVKKWVRLAPSRTLGQIERAIQSCHRSVTA
jgi:hypothetical protein